MEGFERIDDALDLNVYRGEVYGFLGPNGAGKTTTLRMLLGLIRPSAGSAKVMGAAPGSPASLLKVGAIIETPAFYPYMTGYDNLRLLAMYCGVPASRVAATLAEVDLTPRAHHKFSTYSLGMKQRLGIAAALLSQPRCLLSARQAQTVDVLKAQCPDFTTPGARRSCSAPLRSALLRILPDKSAGLLWSRS